MENSNEIKISIPKPCHEDWNKMTPNEKGAFCMKCAKTVVDFTKKTTDEIKDFFVEQSGKKICGRFMNSQLDDQPKVIDFLIPLQLLPKKLSFNKAFIVATFIAFGTTLFSCSTQQGEVVGKIEAINDSIEAVQNLVTIDTVKSIGDTVYNVTPPIKISYQNTITGGATATTVCKPLQGDVAIEEVPTKGEVKAIPQDTLRIKKDSIENEIKTGKIKIK